MECPKRGYAVLLDTDHQHVVKTTCKSWRCPSCRIKKKRLYALRTRYGSSKLGHCYFITVTYQLGRREPVAAESALRDLRRLWSRLRSRPTWKDAAWCRTTELTKNGQVHFHLIVGGIMGKAQCRGQTKANYAQWFERGCREPECLNHELAREWLAVTGDSFVVHVSDQMRSHGLAEYMSKYLVKGVWDHHLLRLGYKRRWICSRNYPSPGRLRLRGSQTHPLDTSAWRLPPDGRVRVETPKTGAWSYDMAVRSKEATTCRNMDRLGIDLTQETRRKATLAKLQRSVHRVDSLSERISPRLTGGRR